MQPAQGGAAVGDHPDDVGEPEDAGGQLGGLAAGGGELAAQGADGQEHRRSGDAGKGGEQAGGQREGRVREAAEGKGGGCGDGPEGQ